MVRMDSLLKVLVVAVAFKLSGRGTFAELSI